MMRVLAVVEGKSEELFLRRLLTPHLAAREVFLAPMQVLRGARARGGGSSWQPWRDHLEGLLATQPREGVCVTTMLDLYRIPKDTPGCNTVGAGGEARAERILSALRSAFRDDPRFLPYLQVHEFEALLYCEPGALSRVEPALFPAQRLAEFAETVAHLPPEAINDGEATAPSKRILAAFSAFDKIDHGVPAIESIGHTARRRGGPRLDGWLSNQGALGGEQ